MHLLKKPIIFVALIMLAFPFAVSAQYKFEVYPFFSYFKDPRRYEIGASYLMPAGQYYGVSQVRDNWNNFYGDTTIKRGLNATQAFAGHVSIAVPFKALGHISCLAMFIQLGVSQYEWTNLNETYSLDGSSFTKPATPVNAITQQISLPLGIDYHVGCDVIETKRLPFCAGFGVGVMPQYNITTLQGVNGVPAGNSFSVTPYAKAEVGFRLGFCWKIRAMYTAGNVPLIDVNSKLPNNLTDGPFSVSSSSTFSVSLILMPFSFGWGESKWYNTYDTYNRYDKLN